MGLTMNSFDKKDIYLFNDNFKKNEGNVVVTLAGNPNVGKSTLFNLLTGMHQHTGNWAGKTVENAVGFSEYKDKKFTFIDVPGTYSLISDSPEEKIAENFLISGESDITVVVCDATCLERNLYLALQIFEICENVILCINLIDEAKKQGINIDINELQKKLNVPIITTNAHSKASVNTVLDALYNYEKNVNKYSVKYSSNTENAISLISLKLEEYNIENRYLRWLSIRLLLNKISTDNKFFENLDIKQKNEIMNTVVFAKSVNRLESISESVSKSLFTASKKLVENCIKSDDKNKKFEKIFDKLLNRKITGIPIMLVLLMFVFWITISLSNYPSNLLSNFFFFLENKFSIFLNFIGCPSIIESALLDGIFHVVSWVVSVMLPPMAIFFPLFTILEDSGFLPRIAYNLDLPFKKCNSCGKQALTMCMGFGCNAVGVVGSRIINSNKERLLSIITNSFMPCNGRFPALIVLITVFFTAQNKLTSNITSAVILTALILFSVIMTLITTKFLSTTVLKKEESSYVLELPHYRKPMILRSLYTAFFDRVLFVLSRSVIVAGICGLIIWSLNNITVGEMSLLKYCADFLDSFAKNFGLDGIILTAFILGLPANEIVIPLMLMMYSCENQLIEISSNDALKTIFISNGWTIKTALCVIIFFVFHWPCSTTIMTIKKETKSIKWTAISVLIPTLIGLGLCFIINLF